MEGQKREKSDLFDGMDQNHFVVAYRRGHVASFGSNLHGQLGHGDTKNKDELTPISEMTKIVKVACTESHTMLLSSDGHLFFFGRVYKDSVIDYGPESGKCTRPSLIKFFENVKIEDFWCDNHFFVRLSNREIWTWGFNDSGQLGVGHFKNIVKPEKIHFFNMIVKIALGGWSTLFLDSKNTVYGCGSNSSGQLGIPGLIRDNISKPIEIKFFRDMKIVSISSGLKHSLFLSAGGDVWKCGASRREGFNSKTPSIVTIGRNEKIARIRCSGSGCVFLSRLGGVWVTGGYINDDENEMYDRNNNIELPVQVSSSLKFVSVSGKMVCDEDNKVYRLVRKVNTKKVYPRYVASI